MCLSVSVSVSVTCRYSIETYVEIEVIFARRLPSVYHALCYLGICKIAQNKAFPSGTLSSTLDLEYFATAR